MLSTEPLLSAECRGKGQQRGTYIVKIGMGSEVLTELIATANCF